MILDRYRIEDGKFIFHTFIVGQSFNSSVWLKNTGQFETKEDGNYYTYYLEVDGKYVVDTVEEAEIETSNAIKNFTNMTNAYIQNKVDEYNLANGTAFNNVHNCKSYIDHPTYAHKDFCSSIWLWSVDVWEAVRSYQSTLDSIPTDEEFMEVLEGVTYG